MYILVYLINWVYNLVSLTDIFPPPPRLWQQTIPRGTRESVAAQRFSVIFFDFLLQRVSLLVSLESWHARSIRMSEIAGNMSVMLVCQVCFLAGGGTGLAAIIPEGHTLVFIEPEPDKTSIIKILSEVPMLLFRRLQFIFSASVFHFYLIF